MSELKWRGAVLALIIRCEMQTNRVTGGTAGEAGVCDSARGGRTPGNVPACGGRTTLPGGCEHLPGT
jgi:hypothetical protein